MPDNKILKAFRKQETLFNLQVIKFDCGCTATIADNFLESRVIPSCSKHLKQVYNLHKYKEAVKSFDEYYNRPVVIGYELHRECKVCHFYVINDVDILRGHYNSQKHRSVCTGRIQAPKPEEFMRA